MIGFASCGSAPCHSATDLLGDILYNGSFNPVYHETSLPPYQNFTVTVPSSATKGKGQINVAHFSLIGVSSSHSPIWFKRANGAFIGWPYAFPGIFQPDSDCRIDATLMLCVGICCCWIRKLALLCCKWSLSVIKLNSCEYD